PASTLHSVDETLELHFDRAGVFALGDGQDAFEQQFAVGGLLLHDALELGANRQHQQVGKRHPVNSGNESHGDTAAQLTGVGQVAHHMDKAHDRADDADGRRITTHAFVDLRRANVAGFLGVHVDFKNAANDLWLGAVDQ